MRAWPQVKIGLSQMHRSKSTSGKQDGISQRDWETIEHTAEQEILRSQPLWTTPTSKTTKSTGRQLNSSHPSTHGIPDVSERPSRSSSMILFHRISVSVHQRYLATPTTDRRIFYIQSPQPTPDWGISYILSQPPSLPLCLLTPDSVQWAHTPLPPPPRTNPPAPTLRAILQQSN